MRRRLAEAAADCPAGFAWLDVAAGTGKVVRGWLAEGGRAPARYTAIEPNPAHAGALRAAIVALGLEGEVLAAAFDPQFRIPDGHDLALFSHSLYWMPDPIGCIR